ncbi:MAG: cyclic nucleotide-binding domain-containing protein [Chloroflexi bacterium]|nr:cyclic nucleotide-binding domain-containing protein [Chloroflexota bacterium]
MTHAVLASDLAALPPFAGLGADECAELAALCETVEYPASAALFQPGAPSDALYIILEGQVEVLADKAGGGHLRLAALGPGAALGERSLLTDEKHSAGAVAIEPSRLLRLSAESFRGLLLAGNPAALRLGYNLGRITARRLAEVDARLAALLAFDDDHASHHRTAELALLKGKLFSEWRD